jgi:hypothetical protein
MKPILSVLGALFLLCLTAPAFAAPDAAHAVSPAVSGGCGVDLAQIMAAKNAAVCGENGPGSLLGSSPPAPLDLAISTQCCTTADLDACRTFCKQQQPSCKSAAHCTAGECVCACSC